MRVLLLLLLGIGLAVAIAAPAAAVWRPPVGGPVVAPYDHVRGSFARGERRGVRFAARPGAAVRAPCGGRVTWAGAVGSVGPGAAVRCGGLSATVTGLASVAVRRGRAVVPGAIVGRAGRAGWVQLGARRPGIRDGYLDPMGLMGADKVPAPPAWRRAPPRVRPSGFAPPRLPVTAPVRARRVAAPRVVTWPLALGGSLALVCVLLGGARRYAVAYRLRRVRRRAPAHRVRRKAPAHRRARAHQ